MLRGESARAVDSEHDERTNAVLLQSEDIRLGNGKAFR